MLRTSGDNIFHSSGQDSNIDCIYSTEIKKKKLLSSVAHQAVCKAKVVSHPAIALALNVYIFNYIYYIIVVVV